MHTEQTENNNKTGDNGGRSKRKICCFRLCSEFHPKIGYKGAAVSLFSLTNFQLRHLYFESPVGLDQNGAFVRRERSADPLLLTFSLSVSDYMFS